jgi:hypothetical protein
MFLALAAGKKMAAALQPQPAVPIEAQSRIGAIELLFDDKESSGEMSERHGVEVFVSRLEARTFEMRRPRIFLHGQHEGPTIARAKR